jgi:hypothetical protein
MATRMQFSAKIKFRHRMHRFLKLLMFTIAFSYVFYLVIDYVQAPSTSVEIYTEWYECKDFTCSYKVELKNKTNISSQGYLRLKGILMMSNAIKSNVTHQFHTEKIKFKLDGLQQKIIQGSFKVQDNNSYLKFKILPI